jgi:hypothetical protein
MPTIRNASGNPIAITDSASAPLQGLRVLGKTTQNGTPTPEAPVPLTSVGDDGAVDVSITRRNLLRHAVKSVTQNGISIVAHDDGSLTFSGTCTAQTVITLVNDLVLPVGTYTIGFTNALPTSGMQWVVEDYSLKTGSWAGNLVSMYNGASKSFAHTRSDTRILVYCKIFSGATIDLTLYPQIEVGSVATAYEPYEAPRCFTLSTPNGLPGIQVSSGGNYTDANGQQWTCDEIDLERGVYVQRVKKTRLTSTGQSWKQSGGLSTRYTWDYRVGIRGAVPMCSHYPCRATGVTSETNVLVNNGGSQIYVNTTFATLAEWKAWLDANDVWLTYALATPVEIDLTIDEVLAYKALKTNHPNTTIMSNEDAWLYAAYIHQQAGFTTYWTDPKTDWKNGDHFNLDPDYERIKNNITHVQELTNKINARVEIDAMGDYAITEYPLAAFLNTIATNIEKLSKSMFLVTPTAEMPMHVGNGPGWTAEELNDIEGNLLNMYEELNRQYALVPRLDIMMGIGGINFGS